MVMKHDYFQFAANNDWEKNPPFLIVVKKKLNHRTVKKG